MADLFEGLEEPIFLVTTDLGKRIRPLGQIVSGVSKASLGGRTITLCLSKFGFTAKVIVERTKCFTLHLLAESNHDLVRLFGTETGRNVDKFDKIQHLLSKDRFGDVIERESHMLREVKTYASCRVGQVVDLGRRWLVIATVEQCWKGVRHAQPPLTMEAIRRLCDKETLEVMDAQYKRHMDLEAAI